MKNLEKSVQIHPKADVSSLQIGANTRIWQFAVILEGAQIGRECNINCHTFVEGGVKVGDRVTLKAGVYLWDGITLEDDVFVGPNATFTNDLLPRSRQRPEMFIATLVKDHASIGANCTILAGITIGAFSMIGAGSVVTRDVPAHALVMGNPARIKGWVDDQGRKLKERDGLWYDHHGQTYSIENNCLKKI